MSPEPIHATPAEARAWARNLRKAALPPPTAPPPALTAAGEALARLAALSRDEAGRALTPAGLSYWQGHAAGVRAAQQILTDLAERLSRE